jgi:hypothetical protein
MDLKILLLTILFMKQYTYIEVRPHTCEDSRCGKVNSGFWFLVVRVPGYKSRGPGSSFSDK